MNNKDIILNSKKYIKDREQNKFHYFSYNLYKDITGNHNPEFFYYSQDGNMRNKFPIQMINSFFSINTKDKRIVTSGVKDELKEFLLLQEKIVNESGFEENISKTVKEFKKTKLVRKSKLLIESILFNYWRARRVSFDSITFAKMLDDAVTDNLIPKTIIIDESTNIQYILDFCTFTFTYFDYPYKSIIDNYDRKYSLAVKKTTKDFFGDHSEMERINNVLEEPDLLKFISSIQHSTSTEDEKGAKNNIKRLMSQHYHYFLAKSSDNIPIINEPYGTLNYTNNYSIFEEINDQDMLKCIHYLFLDTKNILILIPKMANKESSLNFAITSIYLDNDALLYYEENLEKCLMGAMLNLKKDAWNNKNYLNAFARYEPYFEKIKDLLKIEFKEIK